MGNSIDGAGTPEGGLHGRGPRVREHSSREEGINPKMCLYCQAGPTQECDEHGNLLVVQAKASERKKGGLAKCKRSAAMSGRMRTALPAATV